MSEKTSPPADRWRPRQGAAAAVRAGVFVAPLITGYLAGRLVSALLPSPETAPAVIIWWSLVLAAAAVTGHLTERAARRLLPLSVLLRMTMLFPDQAPSRLRVAQRAGNVTELRRRIHQALEEDDQDMAATSELILSLATALSAHDRRTRGHSERTRAYTDLLAEEMGIPEADRDRLRWAALLHDVGKLEIPAEILNKDGPLSEKERDLVNHHPLHGMRLIAPLVDWLGPWAQTIEHHHERYDGSGYPYGLAGNQICLGARIVGVADAYDVMVTGRAYQKKVDHATARVEVAKHAGTQFDPMVVRALMNLNLTRLRWATGPLAAIAELPLLRPLEMLGRDLTTVATAAAVVGATGLASVAAAPALPDLPPASVTASSQTTEVTSPPESTIPGSSVTASAPSSTGGAPATPTSTTVPTEPTPSSTTVPTTTTTTQPTTTTTQPTTTTLANQAPVAASDAASTQTGTGVVIVVLANDSDPDGDPLAVASVGSPTAGTATTNGSTVTYTPDPGFAGADSFGYTVCDSDGACDSTTVSVTVSPSGSSPQAVDDTASTRPNDRVRINVLANDSDPDGDLDPDSLAIESPPAVGTAEVLRNHRILYTAPPLFTGTVTFTYRVCDLGGNCAIATVTVTVS